MSPAPAQPLPPDGFEQILRRKAAIFDLPLDTAAAPLSRYLAEIDQWRRRINLTGKLSAEELCVHALESAFGNRLIAHGERVVDIGSGAGFPGVPIALCRPDLLVTLVEPRVRRAAFLRHVVRELSPRTEVIGGRIEAVGGQTFGVATTRAVGGFSEWIGEAAFLAPGGALLAWTTEPAAVAAELPRFTLEKTLAIPDSDRRVIGYYRKR
jgi:16S rRNA (guanine527-N7)-methyltransferase